MSSAWRLDEIAALLDAAPLKTHETEVRRDLAALGVHPTLVELLAPLYATADGATFFGGRLRLHPLHGDPEHGLPGLAGWNDRDDWQRFEPRKVNGTFYFASNAFGDQLGIPVDAEGAVLFDRVGVLWVERYTYQEAKIPWRDFFSRLAGDASIASFFLRMAEHDWAAESLGTPAPRQCFSSNVPVLLGGPDTLENVAIQPMAVHVSFTLQVIDQAQHQASAGAPLPMVDLRETDEPSGSPEKGS